MNTTLSYPEIIAWIEKKGIELYGKKFKILETDHEIIYKLIAYFLQDEKTCHQYGINLNKGILLTGPIGCGKTFAAYIAPNANVLPLPIAQNLSKANTSR